VRFTQLPKHLLYLTIIAGLSIFTSCSSPRAPLPKTNIENDFLEGFNKSIQPKYKLYATTKVVGKAFWIYIATEESILTLNSAQSIGGMAPEKKIKFLDINCQFKDSVFDVSYVFLKFRPEEIDKSKDILNESAGGGSIYPDYSDSTIEILQKTFSAIGDIIPKTQDMNFFIICLADIKKGLQITFIIHRLDMEQFLLNMLPADEFYNRMILKSEGKREIRNDKYGVHIDYKDISLVEFLREQIVNDARAKLNEMEKFEPRKIDTLNNLDDIIPKSIYEVSSKYQFTDFLFVDIKNDITKERLLISKSKLTNMFQNSSRLVPQKEYLLPKEQYYNAQENPSSQQTNTSQEDINL